jgi:hypothetical protein
MDEGKHVAELMDNLFDEPRQEQGVVGRKPVPFR